MANRFAKYVTPASGGVIVQNPDAATERARKAEEDKRAAIAAADTHATAIRNAAEYKATHNPDGSLKSADGALDRDAIVFAAEKYLADGTMPPLGMGKQAAADREAILNEVAKQAGGAGLKGEDLARQITHYKAGSKALATLEGQYATIGASERAALANGQQLIERSGELPAQTRFPAVNSVVQWVERQTGNNAISEHDPAYQTFITEYAKVVAGSPSGAGVLSDSARHEAQEMLRSNAGPDQKRHALEQMQRDMANRMAAIRQGINEGYQHLTEKPGYEPPATTDELPAPSQPNDRKNAAAMAGSAGETGVGSNGGPPPNAITENRIIPGGSPGAAGFGATTGSTPIPQAMQDEYASRLPSVLTNGRFDPDAFAALRVELDKKYGFPTTGAPRYREWAEQTNKALAHGGVSLSNTIPAPERELSGWEQFRNDAVDNPVGAFVAGAGNAGGFGIPTLLAGDQMGALRDAHPLSSDLGEFAGGVTGAFTTGAGLGAVASKIANPTVASLLAKPLAADVLYSTVSGATQADNPLEGAVGGLVAGTAGSFGGRALGRWLPRVTGVKVPEDSLLPGERRVLSAVDRTGRNDVAAALAQGQELGVPVSLADVSNDVNSLTGAALRRSPKAAGDARVTLGERGRGQYDRFTGAIERDLGPIENIPQRSEDLITQAKASAGPLYDQAYKNDGAGVFYNDVKDLMQRPSMQSALGKARQIAAEEGRDPNALGLVLDKDGMLVKVDKPTWQTWDYVKRGMDDVLEGYRDKTSGKLVLDTQGRAINDTLHDFLGKIDVANPDYAAARAAYATPAAERDALARGQAAVTTSPDQLSVNMGKASPSQADQMRLGFQSSLAAKAGNYRYSTNSFDSVLGTPAMERRLAAMYPDQPNQVARLLSQRDLERQVAGSTNSLIGNSATAGRQVADDAFAQDSLLGTIAQGAVETAITGAPVVTAARSGIGRGLGSAYRDWRAFGLGQKGGALADDISRLALNMDPAAASSILDDMAARDASHQAIVQELLKTATNRGGHIGAGASSAVAAGLMH